MTREEILQKLRESRDKLRQFGVKRIGIFGSAVRDELREDGDIDVIVEFEEGKKNFDNFIELAFFLEELFDRKVDLITPQSVSPFVKPYIEKEVLFEAM